MKTSTLIRRLAFTFIVLGIFISLIAQDTSGYTFTIIKEIPATPVKNQYRSGTCWSFSGISFFESELLRKGKGEFDLSEMFIVRNTYADKARKYVRMHGHMNFSGGGAFNDIKLVWEKYGIMPAELYSGLNYGEDNHVHGEIDAVLKDYLDAVIRNPNRKLSTAWFKGLEGILDSYFGEVPSGFSFNGKKHTPLTFADELGLDMDDYLMLTSFTHHPFYKPFILEVPDNWGWGEVYNVKLDELIHLLDHALNTGYSAAWAADVSEKGFVWKQGIAVVPDEDIESIDGLERARWDELSQTERQRMIYDFSNIRKEKVISQEMRQEGFDNYTTTDDHGMHITGLAEDTKGNRYYLVKNSWGTEGNIYNGYLYVSEAYLRYKTLSVLIHKDALTKELRKKLGI